MAKKITIKQIADLAGVSPGTVDRVLHNRGRVSEENLKTISRLLIENGYKANIHASAISLKKSFRIALFIPQVTKGDYWEAIVRGFESGIHEYSDIDIIARYFTYNQYDAQTFQTVSNEIMDFVPDGVIVGPTFSQETVQFCEKLDNKRIPYVFVDTVIPGTNPIAKYSANQETCGRLLGNMFDLISTKGSEVVIFLPLRSGKESFNSIKREEAMLKHYEEHNKREYLKIARFTVDELKGHNKVLKYLKENPRIKSIAILNSNGNRLANFLKEEGIDDIRIGCFDLTPNNIKCLLDESISFIIYQNPELQAFEALKAIVSYLIFRRVPDNMDSIIKVDVVLKENCPPPIETSPDIERFNGERIIIRDILRNME